MFPARAPEGGGRNSTDCPLTDTEVDLGVECGDGRSAGEQAGYQLALLCCTLFIAIIGGIVTGEFLLLVITSEGFEKFTPCEPFYEHTLYVCVCVRACVYVCA